MPLGRQLLQWASPLPLVVYQRYADIFLVECKAIRHPDAIGSVRMRELSFDGIFAAVDGFANTTISFHEDQDHIWIFIPVRERSVMYYFLLRNARETTLLLLLSFVQHSLSESSLAACDHIEFIVSQLQCFVNTYRQLHWTLFRSLKWQTNRSYRE